ncbi:prenyltransferase/squalene oxidase repeat-containing protein [Streptomyces sp. TP-A0874]|uniref:prenyltransferase/squalene oxidase repeat-containing protein n=1 Tax=Streptomyces sp. TP-A0874 TaxID=549819 RepID=UPI000853DD31|nr:prenyltransferase/squalene oxidase repeat-containing protein [Streptomyces sp. TP-A0874]
MNIRRTAAVLSASAMLCAVAAPAAQAAATAESEGQAASAAKPPPALYGTADPTYDGVWRQSIAMLAQDTVGVTPAPEAVEWLAGQQCDSGAFAPYRADVSAACDDETPVDTNATSAAVQALATLGGHGGEVRKAVDWLKSVQNEDGGWGYTADSPTDANSTSVVIGALATAGEKPEKVTSKADKSPYDGLSTLRLGCDAKKAERGAFAFQPDDDGGLAPNADATAAAALAGLGKGFVVAPPKRAADGGPAPLECGGSESSAEPAEAASAASAYLVRTLEENDHHLTALAPGADDPVPDPANTADAVLALAAGGHLKATEAPLEWLRENSAEWSKENPAALGTLVLTVHATGGDPHDFGGADLLGQLNATGPKPAAQEPVEEAGAEQAKKSEGSDRVWWIVGAFLIVGVGIGVWLSTRKKSA